MALGIIRGTASFLLVMQALVHAQTEHNGTKTHCARHVLFITLITLTGKFLMVIGGGQRWGTWDGGWKRLNDIELVSFDPYNDTVPDCLQNLNAFPFESIERCDVRI